MDLPGPFSSVFVWAVVQREGILCTQKFAVGAGAVVWCEGMFGTPQSVEEVLCTGFHNEFSVLCPRCIPPTCTGLFVDLGTDVPFD